MEPLPTEADLTRAREIAKRISDAAIELVIMRHCLEVDGGEPSHEDVERWKSDVLDCITGDEIGCNDPDEVDATNCEGIWLQELLASLAASSRLEGEQAGLKRAAEALVAAREKIVLVGKQGQSKRNGETQRRQALYIRGWDDAAAAILAEVDGGKE